MEIDSVIPDPIRSYNIKLRVKSVEKGLPVNYEEDDWINFSDRFPKNNSLIEVKSDNLWYGEGIFQDGKFVYSWVKGACFGNPTHWKLKKIKQDNSDGK